MASARKRCPKQIERAVHCLRMYSLIQILFGVVPSIVALIGGISLIFLWVPLGALWVAFVRVIASDIEEGARWARTAFWVVLAPLSAFGVVTMVAITLYCLLAGKLLAAAIAAALMFPPLLPMIAAQQLLNDEAREWFKPKVSGVDV